MPEELITSVETKAFDLSRVETGGACRDVSVIVYYDSTLPIERQRESVIHEIIGTYYGAVTPTETIAEIASKIEEAIEVFDVPESNPASL